MGGKRKAGEMTPEQSRTGAPVCPGAPRRVRPCRGNDHSSPSSSVWFAHQALLAATTALSSDELSDLGVIGGEGSVNPGEGRDFYAGSEGFLSIAGGMPTPPSGVDTSQRAALWRALNRMQANGGCAAEANPGGDFTGRREPPDSNDDNDYGPGFGSGGGVCA